jgi:PilZ domain
MTKTTEVAVEHRRFQRTPYPDLRVIYNGLADTVETRPPDLSPDGMFINTPFIFVPGADLQVRFDLVCSGTTVETLARVRYCEPGVGVGVQFVHLPEPCRQAIEKELHWKNTGTAAMESPAN